MLTYHGVLAPAARWRSRAVPERVVSDLTLHHAPAAVVATVPSDPPPPESPRSAQAKRSWAMLLKRVYELDALECEHCGGRMRVIAAIQPPSEVRKVLEHAGLPAAASRLKPARGPREFELWPVA